MHRHHRKRERAAMLAEAGSGVGRPRPCSQQISDGIKSTWLVSRSNYGKLAGVKSQRRAGTYIEEKRSRTDVRMDVRTGRGKHKLRWGTDYEARAGYHYPSHRDRSTLQQPRLLNTPRSRSRALSLPLFPSVLVHDVRDPPASCPDNAGVGNCKLLISVPCIT